jgi:serine/threonine protein kinase
VNGLLMDGEFPGCNLMQNLSVRMTRGNLRKLVPGGLALAVDDKLVLALTGYTMRIVRIEFANWDEDRVNLMFRGLPDRRRAKEDVTMTLTTSSADLTSPIATEVEVHRLSGDMADLSLTRVDVIASEPLTPRTVTPKTETDMVISRMVPETNLVAIIVPSVLGGLLLILCIVGLALWLRRRRSAAAGKAAQNEDYEAHATPMSKVGDDSARDIGSNRVSSRVETEYGAAPPLINSETDSDRVPSSTSGGGTMALSSGGGGTAALSSGGTAALSSGGGTGALGTKKRKSKSGTQDLPAISGTRRRNGARLDEAESKWELDRSELEMIEEIGRGDFAIVHKARYRGALVAVKTLMPHDDGLTESEFAAFRKEARVMASVPSHKNVVQLVGICTNDPEHFHIVTEFCDGGSLRERLEADRKAKTLEVPTQLRWALECAEGVLHLHHSSIVHRDLAARNLLLHNGAIKVADFGLSRNVVEDGNTTKSDSGPLKYMSPEALSEQAFSPKSDVWAFGVVLWEIFSGGALPFETLTPAQVAMGVVMDKLRLSKPKRCPDAAYEVMTQCWTENAADRPSMQRVLRQLHTVAAQFAVGYDAPPLERDMSLVGNTEEIVDSEGVYGAPPIVLSTVEMPNSDDSDGYIQLKLKTEAAPPVSPGRHKKKKKHGTKSDVEYDAVPPMN